MTPNETWTLNNDKDSVCTNDLPLRLKFWSILLFDHWLSRYKVGLKSEMDRMTPNWIWTLNSQNTLYTLNTQPWGPNFGPFRSTISRFRDTTCTNHQKLEMHRMTPNWTWTLNSQKYSIYTKYLPLRPKFSSVLLYDHPFPRYKVAENWRCTDDPNWT